jgi:hypothetical protein
MYFLLNLYGMGPYLLLQCCSVFYYSKILEGGGGAGV